ncbi:MAG: DUF481 domain-containing protein [Sandaracinaceae bacterium]|nr:DUF481 domain-containing protein [Sandaracinaceae bacterium]
MSKKFLFAVGVVALALQIVGFGPLIGGHASAQTTGAFQETAAAAPAADSDDTVWNVQLGGTLNYGNTRSFQLAGGTHFLVRRDIHLFTMDFAFTYGIASLRDANGAFGPWNTNAQNINGKLRYDVFLDPDWSIFAVVAGRNDPFAGLDFRFQGQLGVSRNLFREAEGNHRLWIEVGADVTYDDLYPNPLCPAGSTAIAGTDTCMPAMGTPVLALPGDRQQYSGRALLGYDNHMNREWRYLTTVEGLGGALMGSARDDMGNPTTVGNFRLNWSNELALSLVENLAVSLRFNFFYELVPPTGRDNVDTQTILSLQYTLL